MQTSGRWSSLSKVMALGLPAGSPLTVGLIPALLLVTPVVVLLRANHYSLIRPEAMLCLLLFALPGLASALLVRRRWASALIATIAATYFIEIQLPSAGAAGTWGLVVLSVLSICHQGVQRIALATLTTLLLSSVFVPIAAPPEARTATGAASSSDPFVLQIILDEHIGLQGLEAAGGPAKALAGQVRQFFGSRGFSVFTAAHSEYSETRDSLSHTFNLSQGTFDAANYANGSGGFEWRLTHNRVLESLLARGYAVRVIQSDYIDLCAAPGNVACSTHSVTELGVLQDSLLSTTDRAKILVSANLQHSRLYRLARGAYQQAHEHLRSLGVPLPPWKWEYPRVSSMNAMKTARTIEEELRHATPGRAVVAHLLLPHDPYVFDEECRIKPLAAWENSADLGRAARENTEQDRLRRYATYVAQTRCLYVRLGRILDAVPESVSANATIVIHGDHGSRIVRRDPDSSRARVSNADLLDDYSTLFAIRSPRAGVDDSDELVSLPCLIKASLVDQGPFPEAVAACRGTPQVYVAGLAQFVPYPGSTKPQEVSQK